jgi:hypothetical protein
MRQAAPFGAHDHLRHPISPTVMHLPQSVLRLERDFPYSGRTGVPSQPLSAKANPSPGAIAVTTIHITVRKHRVCRR